MAMTNSGTIAIERNDINHEAIYSVWKDVVTVIYDGKAKKTEVGNSAPDEVARLLLSEILDNNI